ncbi:hypothetical protein DCCM_0219 [Desulfocucumis palustris]|uniref:Lipoprotein n=1 Tax=Desulfocucumis palustris TaxID=1898651 RepID=A0A2L2X7H3_9FIRM|nr:hypothetical protein [Desulfocucumis palustris]GBF32028.1 hypothetical protein DCCM_0219 [Desulfocucumis palustris]
MKKFLTSLLFVTLLLAMAFGCSASKKPETNVDNKPSATAPGTTESTVRKTVGLTEIAKKERKLANELEPQHKKISDLYTSFGQGKIDREKLNSQLSLIQPDIAKIKSESNDFNREYRLGTGFKDDPLYKDGLKYGKNLRSSAATMIRLATEGEYVKEQGKTKLQIKNLNDAELKTKYAETEKQYQVYLGKLNDALKKLGA